MFLGLHQLCFANGYAGAATSSNYKGRMFLNKLKRSACLVPTVIPTVRPSYPSVSPTVQPSSPSAVPTEKPTESPTEKPTTGSPTRYPTRTMDCNDFEFELQLIGGQTSCVPIGK